ncbi:putative DNA-binding protein (MmcQ/YjbR family) [Haloactinospora alba]|uniref:Putative DNA-binding protein (MmcQ/YjbR family) n=1 Tax=Haloactinospora alba TaxID=405555 RepID=A0A543NNZ2_9ACTN|nr:MmcQ/YjbR family DNA-binding protein [Haloactinospora alba]TQN33559.1 putative DNA-binding protein (MmcQ/YjbR family) [Haloactinospora alba]
MTPQQFIDAALRFPESVETEPYGPGVLVYKVANKSFALLAGGSDGRSAWATLKCDPDLAVELREQYPGVVTPGYHTNKRHWNTILMDGTVPDRELREMLDHSYRRVVAGLRSDDRDRLREALDGGGPPLPESR